MNAWEVTDVFGERYLVFAEQVQIGGLDGDDSEIAFEASDGLVAEFKDYTSVRRVAVPIDGGVIRL